MGVLEIVLLVIGCVIFVLSFVIPATREEVLENTEALEKNEIENLVSQEMDKLRSHVDAVVDETIEYSLEKTERSLERLSNEKIMAVNEYADTVLQEIHRNHEEVVFLYDMLNDKHTNLKNTVTEVNRTVKKVTETQKEAEAVVQSFQKLTPDSVSADTAKKSEKNSAFKEDVKEKTENSTAVDISFTGGLNAEERNSNEKIMELHKQGKSNVAIAKELGLGVGEVKLVIDLYQNM